MVLDGRDRSPEFVELMEIRFGIMSCRVLYPDVAVPQSRVMREMLSDKYTFVQLLARIENHEVFQNHLVIVRKKFGFS
jgi:hypothetical protein